MAHAAGGRLEIRGIGKTYGGARVLDAIDLTVENGEFLTILGPSGSGKTTLLRLIGGFTDASEGRILFDGIDMTPVPIYRRPFNTVFQDYALFPHMTVGQNIGYGLTVRGEKKATIGEAVAEALSVVALDDYAGRYPAQLSGGQQQRVALARALICRPKLILLDEPLAALDAELRRQMQKFLKSIQRQVRVTFLFVTHDQHEAITMSDRICVINDGRVEQVGTPEEIYYRPRTGFVATFFGENNLLPGRLTDGAGPWTVDTAFGPVACADRRLAELAPNAAVTIAVRPEALRVAAINGAPHDDAPGDTRLEAEARSVDFVGPVSQITAVCPAAPDRPLLVKTASRAGGTAVRPGDRLTLVWAAADCAAMAGVAADPPAAGP
ncbi:MAG: ABC transporter ATP-binding protein [Alphaproteobacteria bacterium]